MPRTTPRFVLMLPQPPELATVIRRACSSFDSYQNNHTWTYIKDCRNGNVLIKNYEGTCLSTEGPSIDFVGDVVVFKLQKCLQGEGVQRCLLSDVVRLLEIGRASCRERVYVLV